MYVVDGESVYSTKIYSAPWKQVTRFLEVFILLTTPITGRLHYTLSASDTGAHSSLTRTGERVHSREHPSWYLSLLPHETAKDQQGRANKSK